MAKVSEFSEMTHKQIMGTEVEWTAAVRLKGKEDFQTLDGSGDMGSVGRLTTTYLHPGVISNSGLSTNCFLSNGARYYIDINSTPEYATPENTSFAGLVLSELAGERIVAESMRRFVAENDIVEEGILMKRVIDEAGASKGYHMNLSESRKAFVDADMLRKEALPVAIHTATSLPILGGGVVDVYKKDGKDAYRWSWGQKVLKIWRDFNNTTTTDRPFINERDEPHADAGLYRRFHIIGTDPHILEWAAWMQFGTYSLMLAACRQRKARQLEAVAPIGAQAAYIAKIATYDADDNYLFKFKKGKNTVMYTANDIQDMYIEDAEKVSGRTAEQDLVLEEWKRAQELRRQDVMKLDGLSDSVTKLNRIRKYMARKGRYDLTDLTVQDLNIDKKYTTTFRATSDQAQKLDVKTIIAMTRPAQLREDHQSPLCHHDELEIDTAVFNPPTTTRAYVRGNAIRTRITSSMDWKKYSYEAGMNENNVKIIKEVKLEPLDGAIST
jgi:hypothetical protein